jgi:hypothetical protein
MAGRAGETGAEIAPAETMVAAAIAAISDRTASITSGLHLQPAAATKRAPHREY